MTNSVRVQVIPESYNKRRDEITVLVHGLYTPGVGMTLLAKRLRRAGYRTRIFFYPSWYRSPQKNAQALKKRVRKFDVPVINFVAHSLGGLVVRLMDFSDLPPGRIVTLGTPHSGCFIASILRARGYGFILGRSVQGFIEPLPPWPPHRQLGSLAGTRSLGLSRLVTGMADSSDGVVTVTETRLPGMTDHICLPVSHAAMLVAPSVAWQVFSFLATGRFCHEVPRKPC